MLHNQNNEPYCKNESRIVKLEEQVDQHHKITDEHAELLKEINKNISNLCRMMSRTQATFDTLKWVAGFIVALFGGAFIFIITELIKMIH